MGVSSESVSVGGVGGQFYVCASSFGSVGGQFYVSVFSMGQRRRCQWPIFMVVSPESVSDGGVGGQFHVSVFSVAQRQRCR